MPPRSAASAPTRSRSNPPSAMKKTVNVKPTRKTQDKNPYTDDINSESGSDSEKEDEQDEQDETRPEDHQQSTIITESQLDELSNHDLKALLKQGGVSIRPRVGARRRRVSFGGVEHREISAEDDDSPKSESEIRSTADMSVFCDEEKQVPAGEDHHDDDEGDAEGLDFPLLPSSAMWKDEIVQAFCEIVEDTATKRTETLLELDQSRTVIRREEQERALEGMNGVELAKLVQAYYDSTDHHIQRSSAEYEEASAVFFQNLLHTEEIRKEILLTYQEDLETIDKAEEDLRDLLNRQQKMELDFQGQYEVSLAKHTRKYLEVTDPHKIEAAIEDAELEFLQKRKEKRTGQGQGQYQRKGKGKRPAEEVPPGGVKKKRTKKA